MLVNWLCSAEWGIPLTIESENIEQSISDSHAAMLRVMQGDSVAIGHLAQSLRPYLKQIVRNEIGGENVLGIEDESDIVQKALTQAMANLSGFRGQTLAEWSAWLAAIARNEARMSRRYWLSDRRSVRRQVKEASALLENHAGAQSSISAKATRREEMDRLANALAELTEAQRQLVQWRQNDGLSHADIASRLGITVETSRQRCKSAMDALRRAWASLEK